MEHIIGIGDMKVSNQVGDIIVAPSIGSGIGLVLYDPEARVGGNVNRTARMEIATGHISFKTSGQGEVE